VSSDHVDVVLPDGSVERLWPDADGAYHLHVLGYTPSVLNFEPRDYGAQAITARVCGTPTMRECLRDAREGAARVGIPVVFDYYAPGGDVTVTVAADSDLDAIHREWETAAKGPLPRRVGPCRPAPAPAPEAPAVVRTMPNGDIVRGYASAAPTVETVPVEARIKALRVAATLVDGGDDVAVRVSCGGTVWEIEAHGRHLDSVCCAGTTLEGTLEALAILLRHLLADVRRRGEAQIAAVDAAIAGIGGEL
jgi:hypothetical protein